MRGRRRKPSPPSMEANLAGGRLKSMRRNRRPIRHAAAEEENALGAVAGAATTTRATLANPENLAGSYGFTATNRLHKIRSAQSASPPLPNLTIGDWYARTRSLKFYQTPERTHAPTKTA